MSTNGSLWIVGLGPGEAAAMTSQAATAIARADLIVGYHGYFTWIKELVQFKERVEMPLGQEVERARHAVEQARQGRCVCVISSGDAGIYGMASVVLEIIESLSEGEKPEVVVVPGVSAVNASAALLGAPLGHDFAVISLSDLLTPWDAIEKRLESAAGADFVLALLNPHSKRRDWQLARAREIVRRHRDPDTPVGVVRNAYRPEQAVTVTTLDKLLEVPVDMFTTVIVGNSQTRRFGERLVTPRGYGVGAARAASVPVPPMPFASPDAIMAESFRIIEAEVGQHSFGEVSWPIVRRMIHASGDLELIRLVFFYRDAVRAGITALRERVPIVTDVRMVATGLQQPSLQALNVETHCFIDDPMVLAQENRLITRSAHAMIRAIRSVGDAIYVIGNAPSALSTLCAAVRGGEVRPRLVLAMPVGFVNVIESKEEAIALDVPVIAVRGRKGGSAVAASAMNALMLLALEEARP